MTYKEILKLREGAHVVSVNTETCMAVRLREGFTLTTILPERTLRLPGDRARAHLWWQDTVEDVFSSGKGREV